MAWGYVRRKPADALSKPEVPMHVKVSVYSNHEIYECIEHYNGKIVRQPSPRGTNVRLCVRQNISKTFELRHPPVSHFCFS